MGQQQTKMDAGGWMLVLTVALGYCVDAYDLLVFSAVRNSSLASIGVAKEAMAGVGISLMNWQLTGLVLGGFLWGILADKLGRKSTLFYSIGLYSLANIANALVTDVNTYTLLRFLAGIGLAGELGVGVSLITEAVPSNKRTLATHSVGILGVLGAVLGGVAAFSLPWKACYIIGGAAGLLLLTLRVKLHESDQFNQLKATNAERGSLITYIREPRLLLTLLSCTIAGSATFVCVLLFIQGAPDLGKIWHLQPEGSVAVIAFYLGTVPAIVLAGTMSKKMKSRKKPMLFSYLLLALAILYFIYTPTDTNQAFYVKCFLLGAGTGYWPLLITASAELFPTHIRATSATSVPNIARAWSIPFTIIFKSIHTPDNFIFVVLTLALVAVGISLTASLFLRETFENAAE